MEIAVVLHNIRSVHNVGSIFRTCDAVGVNPHTITRKDKLSRWRDSSFGVGVNKIYLVGVTPTPLDRFGKFRADFSKVALGAEKTVQWEHVKSFAAVFKKLKNPPVGGDYEILAVEQDKRSIPYYSYYSNVRSHDNVVSGNKKIALIFGEETKGLPKSVLDKADKILEIPMKGATVDQARHPKNLRAETLRLRSGQALRQTQGKESLNVSVAFGIVAYRIVETRLGK